MPPRCIITELMRRFLGRGRSCDPRMPLVPTNNNPDIATVIDQIAARLSERDPHALTRNWRSRPLQLSELIQIRNLFDDATFLPGLKKLLARLHNDPDKQIQLVNGITWLMRSFETLRDTKESQRQLMGLMAVGGSMSLVVGGILSLLNPAIGFLALVAVGGGGTMVGTGWIGARRLDDERSVCKQIADRLSTIQKAVENFEATDDG
jgi:hypothetical protein